MNRIVFALCLLIFGSSLQAQTKGARADFGYLSNLAVPDFKAKQAAFKVYTDSMETALDSNPEFIALKEKSKQINDSDQDVAEAGYKAELKMSEMKDAVSAQVSQAYREQFGELNVMVQTVYEVLGQSDYSFVALYEDGELQDYIFKDRATQGDYGQRIYKCAVAKGIDSGTIDLMAQASLSEAQMEIANALMEECKKELLDPFIANDADITAVIEAAYKK